MKWVRKTLHVALLLAFTLALMGCRTVEGAGEDIERAGEEIQEEAEEY